MLASNILSATIAAFACSSSALACAKFKGETEKSITVTDDGTQTCSGGLSSGDRDTDCISGYSLNYDYSDNYGDDGMPVTYCNPHECWSITLPYSSCGVAGVCAFDYSTFGC